MSNVRLIAKALLLTTALQPAAAFAQTTTGQPPIESPPSPAVEETAPADSAAPADPAAPGEAPAQDDVQVSVPGGGDQAIVVRGRRNIIRTTPEVMSILSAEDIARTGEGEVASALTRVTGLSVAGNGYVYVRGLGDRYSLALLNGLALPSPEPLRRVVPLDLFPTSILSSALVQKSYSVNYPGEFGGGVINLTTTTIPRETYLTVGGSVSGDSETTFNLGYTHYGSKTDWLGIDDGERDVPRLLRSAFEAGAAVSEGSTFTREDMQDITASLSNSRTSVAQRNDNIPANWGVDLTAGTAFPIGGADIGVIASAGISNSWKTRDAIQQTPGGGEGGVGTDFQVVRTDNRVVTNGLLGVSAEFGEHDLRWTNLIIRDTLKVTRLGSGFDVQLADPVPDQPAQQINQRTAWYERQLINTQLVGEFDFGPIDVDARFGYANSKRDAPYERNFSYVYSSELGDYINTLTTNAQYATISFSELDEDVWNLGGDVTYDVNENIDVSVGLAYLDTHRASTRRDFNFRPTDAVPAAVAQERPDFLLSDFNVYNFNILLVETSALGGIAAYEADLDVFGAYVQGTANLTPDLKLNAGVRYENGEQSVTLVDLFDEGDLVQTPAVKNNYFLPAATLTWNLRDDMQVRLHGSKTLARPQFRELAPQLYFDTDSDRQFFGNPFLNDSKLTNAEARWEWYFAPQQRFSAAAFYKDIRRPIETIATVAGGGALLQTFANAPKAELYGVELEAVKYWPLPRLGTYRFVTIGNYTYSQSKLKVAEGDTTVLNDTRGERPASEVFADGDAMTGQSKHLANLQLGIENTQRLQQATFLLNYASKRVASRGQILGEVRLDDIVEDPGLSLDFVARQGFKMWGKEGELSFKARNLLQNDFEEYQQIGDNRILINKYDLGTSISFGASIKL